MTATLRSQQEALAEAWRQGLSGQEILHRCADLIDNFIIDTYNSAPAVRNNFV